MRLVNSIGSHKFWLFVLALVPLYLTWTFDHALWNPDETRDAGIAAEMFRSGDYVVPKLNGEAFLEKPPLYYWTSAAIYELTGRVTAGTTRLPSALYGILGVLFTFLIGKRLFNERVGLLGASVLATATQYFRMSHFALMDVALAALVTGAFFFHLKGSKVGFLLFAILAFYAKGFLGVILPGLVVTLHLLTEKRPKELAVTIGLGIVLFAVLVLPWFWGVWKEGGSKFLEVVIIDNHWKRFFSKSADHTEHFWFFYFLSFPVDFLPWTLLYAGHLRDLFKQPQKYFESRPLRFLLLWFFGLLLFFCLSSSKRSIYLLPLFPAASLLCGAWMDEMLSEKTPSWESKLALSGTALLCVLLALSVPVGGAYVNKNIGTFLISAVPVMTLLWILIKRVRQGAMEKAVYTLFALMALSTGLASLSFARYLDRDKSFEPFCEAVKSNLGDGSLIAYSMSEMERGVFVFYLNGPIKNPVDPAQLQQMMEEIEPKSFCLIVNRNKIEEVKYLLQGRVRLIFEHRPGKRTRSYLLYTNNGAQRN